jgi:HPt (histidine-containing phosphotransfer) domain-containing protein
MTIDIHSPSTPSKPHFTFPKNPINDQSFLNIMRASHVIKGASSNLMCQELRETATNLEQAAALGNEIPVEDKASDELEQATEDVKAKYSDLKKAVDSYHEFLDSVDI